MQGILNFRKCKWCEKLYDIATNYDLCPKCRKELIKKREVDYERKI